MIPDLQLNFGLLFQALLPLSAILMIAGFVAAIVAAHSPKETLAVFVKAAAIVALIANLDSLGNSAQGYVKQLVTQELHAHPDETAKKYLDMLFQNQGGDDGFGFWFNLLNPQISLVESLGIGVMFIFSLFVTVIQALASSVVKLVLEIAYGLSPLFLSFLMINSVRSVGVNFLLTFAGLILIPLGWGVSSLVTDSLIKYLTDQSFLTHPSISGGLAYSAKAFLGPFVVSIWVLFSTLASPWVTYRAVTTGSQVGTGLLAAGASTIQKITRL